MVIPQLDASMSIIQLIKAYILIKNEQYNLHVIMEKDIETPLSLTNSILKHVPNLVVSENKSPNKKLGPK